MIELSAEKKNSSNLKAWEHITHSFTHRLTAVRMREVEKGNETGETTTPFRTSVNGWKHAKSVANSIRMCSTKCFCVILRQIAVWMLERLEISPRIGKGTKAIIIPTVHFLFDSGIWHRTLQLFCGNMCEPSKWKCKWNYK